VGTLAQRMATASAVLPQVDVAGSQARPGPDGLSTGVHGDGVSGVGAGHVWVIAAQNDWAYSSDNSSITRALA
jgi:hypothetical protein